MIKGVVNRKESTKQQTKEEFIQDIIPSTIEVDFPSTELGQVTDFSQVKYNNIKDPTYERKTGEILFTISSDGSEHAEFGANLVLNEFVPLIAKPKILVIYVYFSSKDQEYNYANRKENVVAKYSEILGKVKRFSNFLIEDRWTKRHALYQVSIHSERNQSDFLVVGYFGIKGAKGSSKELGNGVDFLLGFSRAPTILVKENSQRAKSKSKGFKWLFVLDKDYVNRNRIVEAFEKLVDRDRDKVVGLGMYPMSVPKFDQIEKEFVALMNKLNIKSFAYEVGHYTDSLSEIVLEKVNFGSDFFDFMCFYNNSDRHMKNPSGNDNVKLITKCSSNICFING